MNYQNGWTWLEDATEEQMNARGAEAALDRLAREAADLYNAIPDLRNDEYALEALDEAVERCVESAQDQAYSDYRDDLTDEQWEQVRDLVGDEAQAAFAQERQDARAGQFAQLEAIEELLGARGARFKRPYEDWNEDEARMEYAERDRDEY